MTETLRDRLTDEADLCRNDGATDVAELLDEAAQRIAELEAERARLVDLWHDTDVGTVISLHALLGMSEADYSIWASRGPTALRTLDQQP